MSMCMPCKDSGEQFPRTCEICITRKLEGLLRDACAVIDAYGRDEGYVLVDVVAPYDRLVICLGTDAQGNLLVPDGHFGVLLVESK